MKINLLSISIGLIIAACLSGCGTITPAQQDAIAGAIGQAIADATNKPAISTPAPSVVAPASVTPAPSVQSVDSSAPMVDPNPSKYTSDYVANNASYEECHIEPATGLMVRYCVYRPSVGQWWLLSSLGEGHVRRDGSNLIAENFVKDGQTIEVLGFCDYEPQVTDRPDALRFVAKGNTCPYDGSRRYIMTVCH